MTVLRTGQSGNLGSIPGKGFSTAFRQILRPTHTSVKWYRRLLLWVLSDRSMKLKTYLSGVQLKS